MNRIAISLAVVLLVGLPALVAHADQAVCDKIMAANVKTGSNGGQMKMSGYDFAGDTPKLYGLGDHDCSYCAMRRWMASRQRSIASNTRATPARRPPRSGFQNSAAACCARSKTETSPAKARGTFPIVGVRRRERLRAHVAAPA